MEAQGLWRLFWATGLPEAWLELRRKTGTEGRREVPCAAPAQQSEET